MNDEVAAAGVTVYAGDLSFRRGVGGLLVTYVGIGLQPQSFTILRHTIMRGCASPNHAGFVAAAFLHACFKTR